MLTKGRGCGIITKLSHGGGQEKTEERSLEDRKASRRTEREKVFKKVFKKSLKKDLTKAKRCDRINESLKNENKVKKAAGP